MNIDAPDRLDTSPVSEQLAENQNRRRHKDCIDAVHTLATRD